jgi:thiamine biosynthesis lipoprotein
MGARAELILNHPNRKEAETAVQLVQDEIRRLEKVFSLYDPGSALSQLNLLGDLKAPPLDLIRCLDDAEHVSRITDGAFDITVQPLWELYARHFPAASASAEGPGKTELETARKLVDYRAVRFDPQRVSFSERGMAVTLNGIAQGYITDRVAELLKARGFANVLIDLGETRGIGRRDDGSDWQVGVKAPDGSGRLIRKLALRDQAIATSGGYGTRFTLKGVYHHLFDPKTGRSANMWLSMSVIADDATRADALSTAFFSLPESSIRRVAEILKVSVIASEGSGTVLINV